MVETSSQLLIVDDDPELLRLLVGEMSHAGHQCTGCDNARDALVLLRTESFDLVVLGWTLADFTGVELCRRPWTMWTSRCRPWMPAWMTT